MIKHQEPEQDSNAVPTNQNQDLPHERHQDNEPQTPSKIAKTFEASPPQESQGKKILTFIGCVCMIYICQIIYGLIEERIYKVPYNNISSSSKDFYTDPLSPMLFSALFAATIGFLRLEDHQLELEIPFKKLLNIALLQIGIHFSLMWALMNASYVLVVMVNSCGLLSVIIVSVYCAKNHQSGQYEPRDEIQDGDNETNNQQRNNSHQGETNSNGSNARSLGPQKILICFIVCLGILIFNYFTPAKSAHSNETSQSASLLTFAVLGLAIILEGFRPQLQTEIKREYQPSPICFYFHYHKVLCVLVLLLSLVTWQLPYTVNFIIHHDELFLHIIVLGLTNAISCIFIFKIITLFRQHVYPLVSTVRKCITVGVSILYFGHHIQFAQMVGIVLVFGGVMLEISMNYKLLQKWGVDLPFQKEQDKVERYVKNKSFKEDNAPAIRKKYQVYKILHKDADIEGI